MQSAIIGFYKADATYEAKRILNNIASRNIKDASTHGRCQADRKKRECEDLLNMFETFDFAIAKVFCFGSKQSADFKNE